MHGNHSWRSRIWIPEVISRSMMLLNLTALRGVVTIVTVTLCWASSLPMSTMGIRWPGHIKGIKTKWSLKDWKGMVIWAPFVLLKVIFKKNIFRKMIYEKIFYRKKREKKNIQIRKTFYRKIILFSVDQKNIFNWSLNFREINTRKYFSKNYF